MSRRRMKPACPSAEGYAVRFQGFLSLLKYEQSLLLLVWQDGS